MKHDAPERALVKIVVKNGDFYSLVRVVFARLAIIPSRQIRDQSQPLDNIRGGQKNRSIGSAADDKLQFDHRQMNDFARAAS